MIQYVLGEVMLADIGTKALTAARLELLKRLMGMGKLNGESEEEEKKGKDEVEEKRRTGQPADKQESRLKQACPGDQAHHSCASISVTKAENEEGGGAESVPFGVIIIYTPSAWSF